MATLGKKLSTLVCKFATIICMNDTLRCIIPTLRYKITETGDLIAILLYKIAIIV